MANVESGKNWHLPESLIAGTKGPIEGSVLVIPLIEGVAVPIRRGTGVPSSTSELSMFSRNANKAAAWEAEKRVRDLRAKPEVT